MKLTDLIAGTKLQLEVLEQNGKDVNNVFVSEVEWVEDDKNLVIAAPIYEGNIYPLPIGTRINLYIFFKKRHSDITELYACGAIVVERDSKQKIATLKVKITGELIKIQRRQYFRFDCTLPVKYRIVNEEGNNDPGMGETEAKAIPLKDAVTRDISGGGVCIALEENVEKGTVLELYIDLGKEENMNFVGKVVRVERKDISEIYKYEAGIAFEAIDDKEREKIIRFIFDEQRKLRKKGLI